MVRSSVRDVLWNDREGRLRTPWRLFVGAAVILAAGVGGLLVAAVVDAVAAAAGPVVGRVAGTANLVVTYAGLAAGLLVAARLVDRRTVRDLGLDRSRAWWADLGFGLALGAALPAVAFAVSVGAGFVDVTGSFVVRSGPVLPRVPGASVPFAFVATAVYFVAVGTFEELFVRGYLLTNLSEGLGWVPRLGTRGAIAVATGATSALFGVAHVANPNATPVAAVTITAYGVFLAGGYLLTGRIAVPVGVHVTWNLALSSVFGFPVSGVRTPATVLAVETTGPELVTGGAFGPEAGLVSLVPLAVGTAALLGWARWREGPVRIHESVAVPELRETDSDAGTGRQP
jgi:membrane protease YdiL (CAAX protease family)